jgi:hypothetical protein
VIHRDSRNRLGEALRHYVSGLITNDDLDDVEVDWRDRGAIAVKQMAWQLYDDLRTHYVEGELGRGSEGRKAIARWIIFLQSDREYLWPEYSFIQVVNWPLNLLTLGWWEKMKKNRWEQFLEAGDFDVWPFCSREELEAVVCQPKLLSGKGAQPGAPDDAGTATRPRRV